MRNLSNSQKTFDYNIYIGKKSDRPDITAHTSLIIIKGNISHKQKIL